MVRLVVLLPALIAIPIFATATGEAVSSRQAPLAEPGRQIDALFQPWNEPHTPGAQVAIIDHGKIILKRSYGCANFENKIPINDETVFDAASVAKQFTAMAIVLLEQDGKLSIENDVHKYLPELPDYDVKITLRNLLQHTSGIRDDLDLLTIAGGQPGDVITHEQALRIIFRQKELNFPAGTRWLYSNAGFTLLAEIVMRVSGEPFPEFCARRIFRPLGMDHTHFHSRLEEIVPNRACSYDPAKDGYATVLLNCADVGPSCLYTTAEDLVRWLDNFRNPKVGGPAAIARLEEPAVLSSGKRIDYAMGLELGRYRGLHLIAHGGVIGAYRSDVLWFPDQEFGVAVLSNDGGFDTKAMTRNIADLYLANAFTRPRPQGESVSVRPMVKFDPAAFDGFAGTYEPEEHPGFLLTCTRDENRFFIQATGQRRFEMEPESAATFFVEGMNAKVTFVTDAKGTAIGLTNYQDGKNHPAHRIEDAITADELAQYAGAYWSDELEAQYRFLLRDGKLIGENRVGEFSVVHSRGDDFMTPIDPLCSLHFLRNNTGQVVGVIMGGDRVFGICFSKKP